MSEAQAAATTRIASRYDVVIIGGSAAGLSAALVLGRARRRVLVVDAGQPRNQPAARMQGFLSRDGLAPSELLQIGRDEVRTYEVEIVDGTVLGVVGDKPEFTLTLEDGRSVRTRRVLVATGLADELPPIDGLRERWARDVLHCPYCHGWEVRDQRLAVIGGGPDAVRYAQIVRQWSAHLVYLTPADTLGDGDRTALRSRGIQIVEGDVARVLVAGDRLVGVEFADGREVECDALFVPPRFESNRSLLMDLGCVVDEGGWPVRDATGMTSVAGVWVAGNVANPRAQVITAAGEGSTAAIAINADLVDEDVRDALNAEPSRSAKANAARIHV